MQPDIKTHIFNPLPTEVDLLLDAFFAVAEDSTIRYASKGAEQVLGYTAEELIGRKMLEFVHPDDKDKTFQSIKDVMQTHAVMNFDNRYIRKDGQIVHLMWSTSWSEAHQLRLGVARDISRIKCAEAMQQTLLAVSEVIHSQSQLDEIYLPLRNILSDFIPGLDFCVAVYETQGLKVIFTSDSNWQPSESVLLGLNDDPLSTSIEVSKPLSVGDKELGRVSFKTPLLANLEVNQESLLTFVATQLSYALERQQMLARLQYMALYDALTDLPNRQLLHDRLLQALTLARREEHNIAVLYLDLDGFKQANDLHGHSVGDALLREVAIRICSCVRGADTVVRFGGDEFVVLLAGIDNRLQSWSVAEKIRLALSLPYYWHDDVIEMSASIGVAMYPEQGTNAESLIRAADEAMYRAKNSGKNCVR